MQATVIEHGYTDTIILGGMNARILKRKKGEEQIMGEHTLGTIEQLREQSEITKDNRLRLDHTHKTRNSRKKKR